MCSCLCAQVKSEWNNYESSFGKEAGEGIKDRSKTTQLVDVFYSLVRNPWACCACALEPSPPEAPNLLPEWNTTRSSVSVDVCAPVSSPCR